MDDIIIKKCCIELLKNINPTTKLNNHWFCGCGNDFRYFRDVIIIHKHPKLRDNATKSEYILYLETKIKNKETLTPMEQWDVDNIHTLENYNEDGMKKEPEKRTKQTSNQSNEPTSALLSINDGKKLNSGSPLDNSGLVGKSTSASESSLEDRPDVEIPAKLVRKNGWWFVTTDDFIDIDMGDVVDDLDLNEEIMRKYKNIEVEKKPQVASTPKILTAQEIHDRLWSYKTAQFEPTTEFLSVDYVEKILKDSLQITSDKFLDFMVEFSKNNLDEESLKAVAGIIGSVINTYERELKTRLGISKELKKE